MLDVEINLGLPLTPEWAEIGNAIRLLPEAKLMDVSDLDGIEKFSFDLHIDKGFEFDVNGNDLTWPKLT